MNSLISLRKDLKRIKGRSCEDLVNFVGQKALFKAHRMVNLIREHKQLSWVPTERYLFKSLSEEIQKLNNDFADIFPLWEARLRTVFLPVASNNFKKLFEQQYRTEKELIFRTAENVARGRIVLFRSFDLELGEDINWHATIINDNTWPIIYFRKINVRDSAKIGDLRTTWELNRHIYWVTLGKAYFLSGEDKYFKVFWNQFDSWTRRNPFLLGINWLSAMEVGIRLNHWLAAYTLFCACPSFDRHCKTKFWCWVYLHIHYLLYHLTSEDRGFRNNHLIIEASSLYLSAILLEEYENSSVWRNKAEKVLSEELRLQFLQDGFHCELCSSYHLQVAEAYLLGAIVAGRAGLNSARKWQRDIYKMIQVLCAIAKHDGNLPMLGDGDDGTFLGLSVDRKEMNVRTVTDIAFNLLRQHLIPDFGNVLSEGAFWFLGPIDVCPSEGNTPEVFLLNKSQYAVLKNTNGTEFTYCLFSVGTKDRFHNYGHRHADLLSIVLSLSGHDIFIDPGTYCYNGPLEWRRFFQRTDSHNTIILNNRDQFDFGGHFGINRINYRSDLKTWTGHGLIIFRGKYIDRDRDVWHSRYVLFLPPHFIIVRDRCGEGNLSEAVLNYILSHDVIVCPHQEHLICNVPGAIQFQMDVYAGNQTFQEAGRLQDKWSSSSYWMKEKCTSVTVHSRGLENFFTTILKFSTNGSYTRKILRSKYDMEETICVTIPGNKVSFQFFNNSQKDTQEEMAANRYEFSCITQMDTLRNSKNIIFSTSYDNFITRSLHAKTNNSERS